MVKANRKCEIKGKENKYKKKKNRKNKQTIKQTHSIKYDKMKKNT